MNPDEKRKIEQYFREHRAEMTEDIKKLVRIRSDKGPEEPGKPFGAGPAEALQCALAMAEGYGFRTKVYGGVIGTADLGPETAGLDMLAHMDVVPVADNWTVCAPFEPTEKNGCLYGRGTADDKGPAVAALYAMRCVKELGIPLNKRVRWIVGTDEECGSSDLPAYYSVEPEAPMTFSPDADFPVINLEKGSLRTTVSAEYPAADAREPALVSVASGMKANVIPEAAEAVVSGLSLEEIGKPCGGIAEKFGLRLEIELQEAGKTKIICRGKGGHASLPANANNALTGLLELIAVLPLRGAAFETAKAIHTLFPHGDYDGKALGIAMADDLSGALTISLNMMTLCETACSAVFDSRMPMCATKENMRDAVARKCEAMGLTLGADAMNPPHYVPEGSDFIRTLLKAYEDWTGNPGKCVAIGGGTYVHELRNGVAFGCTMPGVLNNEHGADEFIILDDIVTAAEIFTQAIIDLCGA